MNDINQRCVSLATGVLSPDLRVNYEFGLVLGVDEFKQEQLYFLEKDYLHNRALHGYGTVYGLKIEATRPDDDKKDVLITVEPGLGIDQCGRPILLRNAQCARLKAWLKKQPADVVAKHRDTSGNMHIYVVASYDECLEALVPIPGAPCSSSESTTAPSRIRDSFNFELRWEPPRMAAWAAVDLFARLMGHVRFVPHLLAHQSDEGKIISLVRELDNPDAVLHLPGSEFFLDSPPADSPPGSPPTDSPPSSPPAAEPFLRLPVETAHEALDRIFTVWVTEVRPRILPSLSDACTAAADTGILLARLDFGLGNPSFDILNLGIPDDTGRPFLLHTQLIQELLFHGGSAEIVAQKPEHEFATLQVRDAHTLRAWVHHPDPLILLPAISNTPGQAFLLKSNEKSLAIDSVTPVAGLTNVFDIVTNIEANTMEAGADVELIFLLDELQVQRGGSLQANVAMLNYDYVGHDATANTITAYTIVERKPAQEFVTFNTLVPGAQDSPFLTLWFHTPEVVRLADQISVESGLAPTNQTISFTVQANPSSPSFLWNLTPGGDASLSDKEFLSFSFDTDKILVGTGATAPTLTSVIKEQQLAFIGYDGDHTIHAFYEVDMLPPQPQVQKPPQPFVTLTSLIVNPRQSSLEVELWFHLDLNPLEETVGIDLTLDRATFKVFAELKRPVGLEELNVTNTRLTQYNVFTATLSWPTKNVSTNALYLRFVFLPVMPLVDSHRRKFSLEEYIKQNSIIFEGDNGKEIVAYVRIPVPSQG